MTPEQFLEHMAQIAREFGGDIEILHSEMDDIMCDTLRELGYGAGVDVYRGAPKWYA